VQSVFVAAFAYAFWRDAVERMPFVLDSNAAEPRRLTSRYALTAVVLASFAHGMLSSWFVRSRTLPWQQPCAPSFWRPPSSCCRVCSGFTCGE
jgi:hypothetical protein